MIHALVFLILFLGCGSRPSDLPDRVDKNTVPSSLEKEREEQVDPRWNSIDPDPYDADSDPVI